MRWGVSHEEGVSHEVGVSHEDEVSHEVGGLVTRRGCHMRWGG